MGTLGDLRARIIAETNRDDLVDDMASALDDVIQQCIEFYGNDAWWFNELPLQSACTINNPYAPIPTNVKRVDSLRLVVGSIRYVMRVQPWQVIDDFYSVPSFGQPTDYAQVVDQIYMWPTPSQAWPLIWETIAEVTPVLDYTDPASSNRWTTEARDLIVAQAKIRLYRDYLSAVSTDPRLIQAISAEADAYANLRGASNRRMATGQVIPQW
jgi:hypothetical protein